MKSKTALTILALFIIAVILIGESYMYVPPSYGYGSDVTTDDNGVTYTLRSDGSNTYRAILLDDGGYTPVSSVYLYYDESERSNVNENTSVSVGGQQLTQKYYLDQVERILRYKGISNITTLNTDEMKEKMTSDIINNISAGKGVIFASGTIPSKLMNDDGTGTICDWISSGGSLYWSGNIFARYISNGDAMHETNVASTHLIGTNNFTTDMSSGQSQDTQFRVPFSIEYSASTYAPKLSTMNNYIASGFSDGEYASMTFIKCGIGQVCILGGEFTVSQTRDLGTAVCSGMCWCSKIVDQNNGNIVKSITNTMSAKNISGHGYLYTYIGDYHCVYGKGHIVKQ